MRAAVATALSLAGVLVAGSAAALVNTQVLSGSDDGSAVGALATSTSAASVPSSIVVAPSSTVAGSTQSTYQVGDAGLVTLDAAGGSLVLVSVAPNPGWSVASTGIGPLGALEVHLVDGTVDVRFLAVLAEGEVTVEVTATEIGIPSAGTGGFDDDHGEDDDEDEHDEDEGEDEGEDEDEEHEHGEGYDDDD